MRFALLGDHPDGLAFARALLESGNHELVAFTSPIPFDVNQRKQPRLKSSAVAESLPNRIATSTSSSMEARDRIPRTSDLEEILADPAIEAVIVAGPLSDRPELLRRTLQSERHVLCVHPADQRPETAYEAGMIRQDVRRILVPLLPEGLHPGIRRLAEFINRDPAATTSAVGVFCLLEAVRSTTGEVLINSDDPGAKPSIPGWDVLRRLGGEIAEISALATAEELLPGTPLLLAGCFERGGLFQVSLLPNQAEECWRFTVVGDRSRAELTLPQGWNGPAQSRLARRGRRLSRRVLGSLGSLAHLAPAL